MKISTIRDLLDADIHCGEGKLDKDVSRVFGCDLMSDVLAYADNHSVLLTGLVNPQVIRTAVMMDMVCIVFVRSKTPSDEMLSLARESGLVVLSTDMTMYTACGKLYSGGLADDTVIR